MATSYNITNFTPDVVPVVFKKDVAHLIATAVGVGWTFMVKADNTATLIAPEPHQYQTIHLSARRNSGPLRRLGAKIMKYADPNLLEQATEPKVAPVVEFVDEIPEQVSEVTLVREGPMISKGANDETYESDIATQREWSDGTVTFHCIKCDFEGKTPKGMASHQRKHAPSRKPIHTTPLDSLTAVLVKRMEQGLDWVDLHAAAHELAEAALKWGVCRAKEDGKVDNDARVLQQIRELVGVEVSAEEVADLKEQVKTLTIQVETERAEAVRAHETLKAARDLFNEASS